MTDGQEWRAWLGRHGPAMLLLARQWVHGHADAEDVVQEAFLRFWRSRDRADDPVPYLYACVKRAAMDWQRGGKRRERREQVVAGSRPETGRNEPMLTSPLEREERRAAVEAALVNLPESQREVLVMKVWGQLSCPQIAEALGIPADTAASRYRYALARLRDALAEELIP